jgi:hypothetical protein
MGSVKVTRVSEHHAMRAYGNGEVKIRTPSLDGGEWLALRPGRFDFII